MTSYDGQALPTQQLQVGRCADGKKGIPGVATCRRARTTLRSLALRAGSLAVLAVLCACGGGGGSGDHGGGGISQPTIVATIITFPSGGVPPGFIPGGFNSFAGVKITDQSGAQVTTASVSVDGTELSYFAADQQYEVSLNVNPNATVTVSVMLNGVTYTASRTNFATYPTITSPIPNAAWSAQGSDLVSWTGVVPDSTAQYAVGVFDAHGALVWPSGGSLMAVPSSQTSTTVNLGGLGVGDDIVLVGLIDAAPFPGAGAGSGLGIGGFTYAPVTVTASAGTVESLAVRPAPVTVGIGKSTQLVATATYSDGTLADVTAQANWASSDTSKATVSNVGLLTGVAAGSATISAEYAGFSGSTVVTVFQPTPSPTPPLTQSVTYQIDYAHSGRATVGGTGPTFPPSAHWSVTLSGNSISYPIIAGGRVFVTTNAPPAGAIYGTTLYALDEATGNVVWGPLPLTGTYAFSGIAYDHGTLFVINFDGLLRTFDAASGTPGYSVQLQQTSVTSPPTAVNGVLYILGGGGLSAVDEVTGNTLWTANGPSDHSAPAVSTDGVFISGPCDAFKFDPLVGSTLWHFAEGCSGGGGKTAVFANGSVYVRDLFNLSTSQTVNLVLDAATGKQTGTFSPGPAPAFGSNTGFFLSAGTLTATALSTGTTLWTFAGDGTLSSAPIVIDQVVVIGSSSGMVYALDAPTGNVLWNASAGAPVTAPDEQNATLTTGLGVGDGYLVVPAGNSLNGWRLIP
jgi:outer membrane protein assembly factor BamB